MEESVCYYWAPVKRNKKTPQYIQGQRLDSSIFDLAKRISCWCWVSNKTPVYDGRAASRCIFVPFEQYGHPKKCAQNSSWNTFSTYNSCKNYMKHCLQILKNESLFKRHKYPSSNSLNIKYFWTLSYNHWGFLCTTKLSNP